MRALTENNLIVDINDRNGGTYIDIQKDGKTFCRKVMPYTYGGFRSWKYKHGCDLTDEQTGIRVESKWWKSHNGSVKHATEDLVRKLIANSHL
jgi:hypothetical protein